MYNIMDNSFIVNKCPKVMMVPPGVGRRRRRQAEQVKKKDTRQLV
jgi:hypothetical protein